MYEVFENLLNQRGISAYKLSQIIGIPQSTLSDWKRGRCTPKQDKLQKIADYFGVTLDYLLTGENKGYYVNDESADIAQEILENKDLRLLFDAVRDVKPEDLKAVQTMVEALKRNYK